MKNILLRIQNNLHLEGDSIISYETGVARIHADGIEVFGKYSRTTSKHITKVATMLGLPIKSQEKSYPYFRDLMYGVNVRFDNSTCPKSSAQILTHLRETQDMDSALVASLTDDEVSAKDKYLILDHLKSKGANIDELRKGIEAIRKFRSKII